MMLKWNEEQIKEKTRKKEKTKENEITKHLIKDYKNCQNL